MKNGYPFSKRHLTVLLVNECELAVSCEGAGWISPSPERSLSFSLEDWVDICIKHYEQEVIIKKN